VEHYHCQGVEISISTITTTNGFFAKPGCKKWSFLVHILAIRILCCVLGRAQTKIVVVPADGAMNLSGTMASDLGDDSIDIERIGSDAEFLELYSHNYPRLQFYLMTMFSFPDDAADVLQETKPCPLEEFDHVHHGHEFFAWAC